MGVTTFPLGISYGRMINNRTSAEIGLGILSLGIGFEFYLTNPRINRLNVITGAKGNINFDDFPMFYLPLGVSYLGEKGF